MCIEDIERNINEIFDVTGISYQRRKYNKVTNSLCWKDNENYRNIFPQELEKLLISENVKLLRLKADTNDVGMVKITDIEFYK